MKISDCMTQPVISISPKEMTAVAARILSRQNIGALPVCEGGTLCGIITDRDLVLRCIAAERNPKYTPIAHIMTPKVRTCKPQDPAKLVAMTMKTHQIHRMPVLDHGQLVGMVTTEDLSKAT